MTESDSQDGLASRQPDEPEAEQAEIRSDDGGSERQTQIAQTRLDDFIHNKLPEVQPPNPYLVDPSELPDLLDEPTIETAGGPGASGGGGSTYYSDLGDLIDGLEANDSDPTADGTLLENFSLLSAEQELLIPGVAGPGAEAESETPFVPPANPVGPGADQSLFTRSHDTIDLNGIDVGGYLDGTQYDALGGQDYVILPRTAREALEAGYTPGTVFLAGTSADTVFGGNLADLIDGGSGHDLLIGGLGDDTLWGGSGLDTLQGDGGNDLLFGDGSRDSLDGGAGNDRLYGGGGDDTLAGGRGNDTLDGGNNRDSLDGGDGNDMLIGMNGHDTLIGGAGNDTLLGGPDNGHDLLIGGAGRDSLAGGGGNDTLEGGSGADVLNGEHGRDLLLGGSRNDTLDGGEHHDTLIGGAGDDIITGGSGKDVFAFSLASNEGDDLILDFEVGKNGDRLQLSDLLDANGDSVVDLDDLDAGGHSVNGTADAIVITFDSGTTLTLDGINGTGVETFADLLDMTVNIDIV